jgi:hypothetical protein
MARLATIFDRVVAVAFPVNFRIDLQHAQGRTCLPVPRLRGSLALSSRRRNCHERSFWEARDMESRVLGVLGFSFVW